MNAARSDAATDGGREQPAPPKILLFMRSGRNRDLLEETLSGSYGVECSTDVATLETDFDCCVFDYPEFNRVAGTIQERRNASDPYFLPFVLLLEGDSDRASNAELWRYLDDVIRLPVEKSGLVTRIQNLVDRRRTSVALAEREGELAATVEDLRLKERAMDAAPVGISITDTNGRDNPLIYINEQFQSLTGYSEAVLGQDCRFLQGEDTDPETVERIRAGIEAEEPMSMDVLNYRKNGQRFWNLVKISPLYDPSGELSHFVGFQTDITDRKIRERRLEVLNRVLGHNLRNKMNIVQGHVELLKGAIEGDDELDSLATIEAAAEDLFRLGESVRDIEQSVSRISPEATPVDLGEELRRVRSEFRDRYETATIELTLPEQGLDDVEVPGLVRGVREVVENAIVHNEAPNPSVDIRVQEREDGWLRIEIEDDGPGIPEQELEVLEKGESAVVHADRLGMWLIHWIVTRAGGSFDVSEAEPRGTVVEISVPKAVHRPFDG